MFQSGTYVVYGCKGVHKITGITTLNLEGIPKDKNYYILEPLKKTQAAIYAPVEEMRIRMRPVMSREEAEHFLQSMGLILPLSIRNPRAREEACRECIRSCEPDELLRVIKTLQHRKTERARQGKKLTLCDLHYMEQAESTLYEELSLSLSLDRSLIEDKIRRFVSEEEEVRECRQ